VKVLSPEEQALKSMVIIGDKLVGKVAVGALHMAASQPNEEDEVRSPASPGGKTSIASQKSVHASSDSEKGDRSDDDLENYPNQAFLARCMAGVSDDLIKDTVSVEDVTKCMAHYLLRVKIKSYSKHLSNGRKGPQTSEAEAAAQHVLLGPEEPQV